MPSGHDDIIERLDVAINAWNIEIAQMRGGLAGEIDKLGEQIGLLPHPKQPADDFHDREFDGDAALKARVEQLEALLQKERAKAEQLEEKLHRRGAPSAEGGELNLTQRLAQALRDRDEAHQEIVTLRAENDLLRRANACLSGPVGLGPETIAPPFEVFDEEGRRRRLGEILLELELLTGEQLASALSEQAESPNRRLGAILCENGVTTDDIVAKILARQLGLPYVRLSGNVADLAAARVLDPKMARAKECLPIAISPKCLMLAMANPFDLVAIEDVEIATGRRVNPVVAAASELREALKHYCAGAKE